MRRKSAGARTKLHEMENGVESLSVTAGRRCRAGLVTVSGLSSRRLEAVAKPDARAVDTEHM